MQRLGSLLIAFACGAVTALSMPPVHFWPGLFIGLGGFYALLARRPQHAGILAGWAYGIGYFLVGLYWIGNALLVPGNDFAWAWPLAVLGLPLGLGLFTALAVYVALRLTRFMKIDFAHWRGALCFALCMALAEWLRGHVLTGFPWNLFGYGWAGLLPMMQSVAVIGSYGLSLLTVAACALAGYYAIAFTRGHQRVAVLGVSGIAAFFLTIYGLGAWRLQENPTRLDPALSIRLVQPNIAQEDKWKSDKATANFDTTANLSTRGGFAPGKTHIIIWPETAVSEWIWGSENANRFFETAMQGLNPATNIYLVTGLLRREPDAANNKVRFFNSLATYRVLPGHVETLSMIDKAHLVPFGEYIPLSQWLPLTPITQFAGFESGTGPGVAIADGLPAFRGLICYEIIFPAEVADKTQTARWMVNVTNDGWYGDSPGPYQHLSQSVIRAIENGIPLVRAANTGISAIIDPYGRTIQRIEYGVANAADSPLPLPARNFSNSGLYRDLTFPILNILLFLVIFAYPSILRDRD